MNYYWSNVAKYKFQQMTIHDKKIEYKNKKKN